MRIGKGVALLLILSVFSVFALNQAGVLKLSSSSYGPSSTQSPSVWCASAQSTIPLANIGPNGNPNNPGCYTQQFTTFKIATVDAISGAATNALFIRIISAGGPLNAQPYGTPLEGAQESSNVYTATGNYQTGQALIIQVCSGSNGAAQATTCTSDFTAGNSVTYYSIQAGPAGQGAGYVPFATSLSQVTITITQPVFIVQNKYQITGTFAINGTSASTGVGSGGSAGAAKSFQNSGSNAIGKYYAYNLAVINTYSTTTFPYEAGFVSSAEADINGRALNDFLQCALTKTGGTAGDAPTISGMPQIASTGGGVTAGGTTYYAVQVPDPNTQKIAQNSFSPLQSAGNFNINIQINQAAVASGDTFTFTCNNYMWYNLAWVQQYNGALNTEAVAMTGAFVLTMTF